MKRLAPAMSSRFRIDPNPPVAGRSLSVTYIGPADEVEYQIDDGTAVRIRPDENGRFLIDRVHRQRIVRVRILPRQEVGA